MAPTLTPNRAAFREAVAQIAAKATEKLPECNGRVDLAVKLVLAGDVELAEDGTARVFSQSNGVSAYQVVNGHCDCLDFAKAPHGFCKHRLAAAIYRRTLELCPAEPDGFQVDNVNLKPVTPPDGVSTTYTLPEAPASVNCHITVAGRQVQLTLRDSDETRLLTRLQKVLEQFPVPEAPHKTAESAVSPPRDQPGWCAKHGVPMRQTTKHGRSWFSHHIDGQWCKGR